MLWYIIYQCWILNIFKCLIFDRVNKCVFFFSVFFRLFPSYPFFLLCYLPLFTFCGHILTVWWLIDKHQKLMHLLAVGIRPILHVFSRFFSSFFDFGALLYVFRLVWFPFECNLYLFVCRETLHVFSHFACCKILCLQLFVFQKTIKWYTIKQYNQYGLILHHL